MLKRFGALGIIVTIGACLLLAGGVGSAPEAVAKPGLQATFLQLTAAHGDWPPEKWAQLFDYFRQLKLTRLIVQWSVYDDLAFFPAKHFRQVDRPPLETILKLADGAHMEVLVGLAYDSQFWAKIEREPRLVEIYLRRLRLRSQEAAEAMLPWAQAHPSFRGWYLPEEVDDVNWQQSAARCVLIEHLRDLGRFLRRLTPTARLALSGFADGRTDPQTLGRFWQELLAGAPLDLVLFQDGIGAQKLSLEDLPPYLNAMQQATISSGRHFQVVVELFQQVSARPFQARPAPWPRLERQLALASKYSDSGAVGFSVPEYLTPLGGPAAARLYEAYLGWLKSDGKPENCH